MTEEKNDPSTTGSIRDVDQLEELLSRPTPEVTAAMAALEGDLIVLGAGGKTGPSLARMARRASDAAGVLGKKRRVIGVSRFSTPGLQEWLESQGVETIRCDLLERRRLESLPKVANVLYLAAMKFGSTGNEPATWAMNTYLPGMVAETFSASRIVAYSTGNVYAMTPATSHGSVETDPPAPIGDYAMSCLGRERMFAYFSQQHGTPVVLLRLNYANEMRYGVMVDIAGQVMAAEPVDLRMGYFNVIWQGDSNAMTLRALAHAASPPLVLNVAGPDTLSVRKVAERFGQLMNRPVGFRGTELPDAFLSDGRRGYDLLGPPTVGPEPLIRWIADWQLRGGPTLGKPTHFQTRDGKF